MPYRYYLLRFHFLARGVNVRLVWSWKPIVDRTRASCIHLALIFAKTERDLVIPSNPQWYRCSFDVNAHFYFSFCLVSHDGITRVA